MRSLAVLLSACWFLLAGGCVRVEKPRYTLDLQVARGSQGATLKWNTLPGNLYTVQYRIRGGNTGFTFHPKGINLKATGDNIIFNDPSPDNRNREYRIVPAPVTLPQAPKPR